MATFCFPCCVLVQTDVSGLLDAIGESKRLAEQTMEMCGLAQHKGRSVLLESSNGVRSSLGGLGGGSKALSPTKFQTIANFLDESKRSEMVGVVQEMADLAVKSSENTRGMAVSLQRGMDCLPDMVKTTDEDEDEAVVMQRSRDVAGDDAIVSGLERDIAEIQECTESVRTMNLWTAATKGNHAFDSLSNKTEVCLTVLERIKELCGAVARIAQSLLLDNAANCCDQVSAAIRSFPELKNCLNLTTSVQALADAGMKLIQAFLSLVQVAWGQIANFLNDFPYAKRISNWVNRLNPMQGFNKKQNNTTAPPTTTVMTNGEQPSDPNYFANTAGCFG